MGLWDLMCVMKSSTLEARLQTANQEGLALSFWQPYAWLIVNGVADVDSRLWAPPAKRIGERIYVHASKRKITRAEYADFAQSMKHLKIREFPASPAEFDYGAIVGSVVIDSVTRRAKSYWAHAGYFHWVLKAAKKIKPIVTRGQMGWFTVFRD